MYYCRYTARHTYGSYDDPCVPYMPAVRVCVNVDTCGSRYFPYWLYRCQPRHGHLYLVPPKCDATSS